MYATSKQALETVNESRQGRAEFLKMLSALATGALFGLLVGLSCGRGGNVPGLRTIVQTLAALTVSTGAWIGTWRRPAEPFCPLDVSHTREVPQKCLREQEKRKKMSKSFRFLFAAVVILTLAFISVEPGSAAYGTIKSALTSQTGQLVRPRDAKVQTLVEAAKVDLGKRGIAAKIRVQSVEPAEFVDGSLGAPEPNKPYPLVVTSGYHISLRAKSIVYRYWAVEGRVVYVGSYVEPAGRLPGVRGLTIQ
jgi:hypothetical protein